MNSSQLSVPQRFWHFLRKYQEILLVASAGNFLTVGIVMLTPIFVKLIIDEAIPGRNFPFLAGIVVIYLVVELLRQIIGYAHLHLQQYVGQRVVFDIRSALFHHLQMLHLSFYETQRTASLVNRVVHDAASIQQFINISMNTLSNSLVSLVMAVTIMFFLNWKLAIFCISSLPVYYVIVHFFRKNLHVRSHDVQERQSALAGALGETFSGIKVVKAFAQEDHERKRFLQRTSENFSHELELPLIGLRMSATLSFLYAAVYGTVLFFGGWGVMSGTMTLGAFVAFNAYLTMLFGPVSSLSVLIQSGMTARAGFERILGLLDIRPKITEASNPVALPSIRGEVEFDRVGFSYGDQPAIRDLSMKFQPGEIIALVGPSGSGKSTFVSLLTRFYDPTEGVIRIDGHDLRGIDYDLFRQQVGIVLQDNFLFTGTIGENIRYGCPDASPAETRRAAELANAWEFISKMPLGMDSQVGQGGVTLSGGQRQRIAIARCLLKDPRILILDEATSALDNESEVLVQQSLDTLMEGRTVFVVAHRLSTIRRARRILVMDRGTVSQVGTHEELMACEGTYRNLQKLSMFRESSAA
jgi:subfamily B ATP-binding cassette protein MsbA